jgi:hypothetical protein
LHTHSRLADFPEKPANKICRNDKFSGVGNLAVATQKCAVNVGDIRN